MMAFLPPVERVSMSIPAPASRREEKDERDNDAFLDNLQSRVFCSRGSLVRG